MREFSIRRGTYAGTHLIFDSIKEAKKHGIKDIKSPWYSDNVEPGDWVISDDGYVIQCLGKRLLINKRHKSGQYTQTWRFPNGTFYIYRDARGNKHIKNFYAVAAANHKSSMGNTPRLGRYMTLRKKEFCMLIGAGLDPYQAYIKAYRVGTASKNSIWIQVNKLLNDKMVQEEVMEELKPFLKKVEDRIKAKTGHGSLVDLLADKIAELFTDEDLKAKDVQQNIKLAMELFAQPMGLATPRKNRSLEADEADFELLPPPLLGDIRNDNKLAPSTAAIIWQFNAVVNYTGPIDYSGILYREAA